MEVPLSSVGIKVTMCRYAYHKEILGPLELELWSHTEYARNNKQFVNATPLQQLHRISVNFVSIKDTKKMRILATNSDSFNILGIWSFLKIVLNILSSLLLLN